MNLESAASIGIGLLKHREEIGAALGGLGELGNLSGKGFAAIAGQFGLDKSGFGKKLTGAVSNALDEQANPNNISSLQALSYLNHFDADKNGEVSRQELTEGLQKLEDSGLASHGLYRKLYETGELLLKNYDKAAALDGDAGSMSYRDLGKLVNLDNRVGTLSTADWDQLNA